jgi:outer membrane protein OmpA-like peptidoglycan-associated protein/opacity protein-like surface antigen
MKKILSVALFCVLAMNANAVNLGKVSKMAKKASTELKKASAELNEIAKKLERLQSDKIKVNEDERGVVLTFSAQLFAVGKADLTDEAKENLLEVSKTLAEYPDAEVEIEGHTDSTGSAKLNQDLSERRATNVMNFLVELGVEQKRLSAVGYGKDRPIADNKTEEGRAQNRRVELVVKVEKQEEVQEEKEKKEDKPEKEGIRFGVRAGIAGVGIMGELEIEDEENRVVKVANEPRFGVGIGGIVLIPVSFIYFVPELFIHYRRPGEFPYPDGTGKITLSEIGIDIPLMFRFPFGENRKFYLEAGPQIGFVINPTMTLEGDFFGIPVKWDFDIDNRFFEYGLALGAGYRITDNWGVDLRGYYSLANIKKLEGKMISDGEDGEVELSVDIPLNGHFYYVQIGVSYIF